MRSLLAGRLSILAVSEKRHRHLMWWVFTLPLYFPWGVVAAYKALYEFVFSPFYWDKTAHGLYDAPQPPPGQARNLSFAAVVRLPRRA